jgi:hypothetical protein
LQVAAQRREEEQSIGSASEEADFFEEKFAEIA